MLAYLVALHDLLVLEDQGGVLLEDLQDGFVHLLHGDLASRVAGQGPAEVGVLLIRSHFLNALVGRMRLP